MTIYTDGSAQDGNAIGGGGIIVTTGPPSDPTVLQPKAVPAGSWCSSFQAEEKALSSALQIILETLTLTLTRMERGLRHNGQPVSLP